MFLALAWRASVRHYSALLFVVANAFNVYMYSLRCYVNGNVLHTF